MLFTLSRHLLLLVVTCWLTGQGFVHILEAAEDKPFPGRSFSPWQDTFAFCNETVWNYKDGKVVSDAGDDAHRKDSPGAKGESYSRRCFVMSRATMQFWKFARFDASQKRVSEEEYRRIIRRIARVTVWRDTLPASDRIVVPGFTNLRTFSTAYGELLRANLGEGWPTYFRPGNFALPFRPSAEAQRGIAKELRAQLKKGDPAVLWLANFPSLNINHAVVAYGVKETYDKSGDYTVWIYDPNCDATANGGRPSLLKWNSSASAFSFNKTFYFPGGEVSVRHVFTDSWH